MNAIPDLLPWQLDQWRHLVRYVTSRRIPQSVLFAGHKGIGKSRLAARFAHALVCLQPTSDGFPCGICHSCLLIKAQTHPDLLTLSPEEPGKSIKIDQIRKMLSVLSLKPQYEANRVVIVEPADQLNIAAVNAFLKFLEEPTERTVLLLITDRPSRLPATLLSRCQKIYFSSPGPEVVKSWLSSQGITNEQDVLIGLSEGAPLLALNYAGSNVLELRQKCFGQWLDLARRRIHPSCVAEQWVKLEPDLLLVWITGWIVDMIKSRFNAPLETSINRDLHKRLQKSAETLELNGLYRIYDLMLSCRARIDTQLNKQLMFEEILIEWAQLNDK